MKTSNIVYICFNNEIFNIKILRRSFYPKLHPDALKKLLFQQVICVLRYLGHITTHKFMQFHMDTANIVYLSLNIQCEYSTTLISHKTSFGYIKNCY
jgi:hypothetical protein